ncbi:MAG: serine protease [Caldimonas sp.]
MLAATAGCSGDNQEGLRSVRRADAAGAERIQLDQLVQANRRLELDIEQARKTPGDAADCPPGTVRLTPEGRLQLPPGGPVSGAETDGQPDGSLPAASAPQGLPQAQASRPAPASGPAEASRSGDALAAMSGPELAKKLEQATALVLTDKGTGTGFFINDKLLVTNRHVVEAAAGGNVFVTSRALGMKRRATVLRVTAGSSPGDADFALIRLDDGSGPGFLGVGTQVEKLSAVVVAGYPGLAIRADPDYARLMSGDGTAAPDLNFTQGSVQSLTQRPGKGSLILHTASILKGNSGGPLVDMCGRVVGVNTFIALDEKQAGRLSYALGADGLLAFLKESAGVARGDARGCAH